MASNLHACSQLPQPMHLLSTMKCGAFFDPMIAAVGHFFAQMVHPVHLSTSIEKVRSSVHTPAGHCLSKICASYSSLNQRSVLSTGLGAVWPKPHREVSLITFPSFSSCITPLKRSSESFCCPLGLCVILSSISSIRLVPSRQGMHLPQLSRCMKSIKNLATSTMQVSSSITTRPPLPIIAPALMRDS